MNAATNQQTMSKNVSKRLTVINLIIVGYFTLIYLVYVFKIKWTLVGVFQELLTIPFFVAQLIFLGIGIKHTYQNKTNIWFVGSFIALTICAVLTISSLF